MDVLGNVLRIVIGLGGLILAGRSALRTVRLRRQEPERKASFGQAIVILAVTAVGVALTVLL